MPTKMHALTYTGEANSQSATVAIAEEKLRVNSAITRFLLEFGLPQQQDEMR